MLRSLAARSVPRVVTLTRQPWMMATRSMSTTPCRREEQEPVTEASAYPFAKHVITRTHTTPSNTVRTPVPEPKHPSRAIMTRVDAQLANELDPDEKIARLFSRKSPDCIPPGSVVMVETYLTPARTTSTAFSGVLIAVRRAGVATTFVLRTIAHKLGVEMRFHAYSPMIKDIKVIQRADAKKGSPGLTRTRRAKLYYMRRREDRRINAVAGLVKQYRAAEQQKAPSATKPASSKALKKKK